MKQVLLIESEFYTRVQLDDELAPYGYQVTSVKRVKNALIKMKTQIFNLIIISYDEQVDAALSLLATLRQGFNTIPVVVMTKRPTEEQLLQLLRFRPVELVVKPYSLVDLLARMSNLLEASDKDAETPRSR